MSNPPSLSENDEDTSVYLNFNCLQFDYDSVNSNKARKTLTLYEEVDQMLETICIVSLLIDFRSTSNNEINRMAISSNEMPIFKLRKKLRLPLAMNIAKQVISSNHTLVSKHITSLDNLHTLLDRMKRNRAKARPASCIANLLVSIEDLSQKETPCLTHAVHINHDRKSINITFCPSAGRPIEWHNDNKMKPLPNPMKGYQGQSNEIYLHRMIADVLFLPYGLQTSGSLESFATGYHTVVHKTILPMVKKYPAYKLEIGGHGVGGAIACAFSFVLSSESPNIIPKPITCITFGSFCVGDDQFARSFRFLEDLGYVRHIRIANNNDFITKKPSLLNPLSFFDDDVITSPLYSHCGMLIILFEGQKPCEVHWKGEQFNDSYDELDVGGCLMTKSMIVPKYIMAHHMLSMYNDRWYANESYLDKIVIKSKKFHGLFEV